MRILLGMPSNGSIHPDAATAFHHPVGPDSPHEVRVKKTRGPEVLMNHNSLWADALDDYEAGNTDAFALLHSDVAADPGWLDILANELGDADVISAVIPIKNASGLTSTAVDDTGEPYLARRLVMKEIAALPKTFSDAEVGGPILLNTGMWLVKLGPWCLKTNPDGTTPFVFEFKHWIRRGDRGRKRDARQAGFWPDDWNLSRRFREAGLKQRATSAVKLIHYDGPFQAYPNFIEPYGWDTDIQNGPKAPWRIARSRGFELDADLAGVKARTPDGEIRTIRTGRIEGADSMLDFEDGTTAPMIECTAVA